MFSVLYMTFGEAPLQLRECQIRAMIVIATKILYKDF